MLLLSSDDNIYWHGCGGHATMGLKQEEKPLCILNNKEWGWWLWGGQHGIGSDVCRPYCNEVKRWTWVYCTYIQPMIGSRGVHTDPNYVHPFVCYKKEEGKLVKRKGKHFSSTVRCTDCMVIIWTHSGLARNVVCHYASLHNKEKNGLAMMGTRALKMLSMMDAMDLLAQEASLLW